MHGRIIKGIAGFYYVSVVGSGVYSCKAKGIFRRLGIRPLPGDFVEMDVTHEADMEGNITRIRPRKNELIRPAVANVDQALVIFAYAEPEPNLLLLDRFLVSMEFQNIPCVICLNKTDCVNPDRARTLQNLYQRAGYRVISVSAAEQVGIGLLREALTGRVSTVAGPSGVGKSSLINLLVPDANMEIGALSAKVDRGRHTTRHSELLQIDEETYIMDTPGFTSLYLPQGMEPHQAGSCFPEFRPYLNSCRFAQCSHIAERECGVKDALEKGEIPRLRYEHYTQIYRELNGSRKY